MGRFADIYSLGKDYFHLIYFIFKFYDFQHKTTRDAGFWELLPAIQRFCPNPFVCVLHDPLCCWCVFGDCYGKGCSTGVQIVFVPNAEVRGVLMA
jgi:hypothetical protein